MSGRAARAEVDAGLGVDRQGRSDAFDALQR